MDPNMMSGMGDFLKNPAMMQQAMEMMKNNPELLQQMMGGTGGSPGASVNSSSVDDSLLETDYDFDDRVVTKFKQ